MAYADEGAYEEMIDALSQFLGTINEQCAVMNSAAEDCVDNTIGDPAAVKSAAKVSECASKIEEQCEKISGIISALNDELEEIRAAAERANFD